MRFNDIVKSVAEVCPRFNDVALRGFVKEQINNSPEFPAALFREAFKFIPGDLEFINYDIMSPEERVRFELRSTPGKSIKAKIPLTVSHLRLCRYRIRFGKDYLNANLYTPYIFEDMLYLKDKRSMIRKVLLEKTFSRVNEKEKDGLTVAATRVSLVFNRRQTLRVTSYVTNKSYAHFIVTAKLFHGKIQKKICDTNILHYMFGKFGFVKTLNKFGLTKNDIMFTTAVDEDTEIYEYFAARPFEDNGEEGPGLFLKVRKPLLDDDQTLKFVVNILYILKFFRIQNIDNVYAEEGSIWKVIIGIILLEDRAELKAYSNAESHFRSVDHFIDPTTRDRFRSFGVIIDDIYDLLMYIFVNIDTFMVNNLVQDLYNTRLDVSRGIFVGSFAKYINHNMYVLAKKSNITLSDVSRAISFHPLLFRQPSSNNNDDNREYLGHPDIVGDNLLLSGGLNKIRMGGKPEQRLHPSMAVVESVNAFVGKTIGKTGYINPYVPTDANGAILHPDYAKEVDEISPYLPK